MINEMKILKDLEYVRVSASKEELKAAKYIQSTLKGLGLSSTLESFKVQASSISKRSLEITKPFKRKVECIGYKNSISGNITKELYYLRNKNDKRELVNVKDKIVLIDSGLPYWTFKDLLEYGAAGFITCNGQLHDDDTDIDIKELRAPLKEMGRLPGVNIHTKEFYKLVKDKAKEAKLVLNVKDLKDEDSHNVVCKIKGETDRNVILTAHYDSVPLSKGVYDNATGVVALLKVAEYFSKHKPHNNLIIVWCGSEERGLLGSKAYCKKHKKELDKIDLDINIDMVGSNLGKFITCVSGEDRLVSYIDYFSSELGFPNEVKTGVYSSDSTPFADNGVPSLSFARVTPYEPIHCKYDDIEEINEDMIKKDCQFIVEFTKRMANSIVIPVKREIPEKVKEELDYYMTRKRKQ